MNFMSYLYARAGRPGKMTRSLFKRGGRAYYQGSLRVKIADIAVKVQNGGTIDFLYDIQFKAPNRHGGEQAVSTLFRIPEAMLTPRKCPVKI